MGKYKNYTLAFRGILCSESYPELAENLMFQMSFGLSSQKLLEVDLSRPLKNPFFREFDIWAVSGKEDF